MHDDPGYLWWSPHAFNSPFFVKCVDFLHHLVKAGAPRHQFAAWGSSVCSRRERPACARWCACAWLWLRAPVIPSMGTCVHTASCSACVHVTGMGDARSSRGWSWQHWETIWQHCRMQMEHLPGDW